MQRNSTECNAMAREFGAGRTLSAHWLVTGRTCLASSGYHHQHHPVFFQSENLKSSRALHMDVDHVGYSFVWIKFKNICFGSMGEKDWWTRGATAFAALLRTSPKTCPPPSPNPPIITVLLWGVRDLMFTVCS